MRKTSEKKGGGGGDSDTFFPQRHLRWYIFSHRLGYPSVRLRHSDKQEQKKKKKKNCLFSTKTRPTTKTWGGGGHFILCPPPANRGGDTTPPPPPRPPGISAHGCVFVHWTLNYRLGWIFCLFMELIQRCMGCFFFKLKAEQMLIRAGKSLAKTRVMYFVNAFGWLFERCIMNMQFIITMESHIPSTCIMSICVCTYTQPLTECLESTRVRENQTFATNTLNNQVHPIRLKSSSWKIVKLVMNKKRSNEGERVLWFFQAHQVFGQQMW